MTKDTSHPAAKGQISTLIGMGVNIVLVIVKGVAGVLGNSYALIADAVESATDLFTSLFVWLGLRAAAREPDDDHPYGHGKAEPLAAIIVSMALWGAAILISLQSIDHIRRPHKVPEPFTLVVLFVVVVIKEFLYHKVHAVGHDVQSSAVKADAWHHRSDAITSFTAFIGIAIAIIGGPGYESADDWAALIASGIIVYNAWLIFRPAFGEIMDEKPEVTWFRDINKISKKVPGVIDTEKCHVRKMGFDFFIDLHVTVDGDITVREGHDIAHAVKAAIQAKHPQIRDVLIHIEPDGLSV
ncbi:MAG TPA: cation diffusion facilitator family transporter [Alphaproteobacteria bacterium]